MLPGRPTPLDVGSDVWAVSYMGEGAKTGGHLSPRQYAAASTN